MKKQLPKIETTDGPVTLLPGRPSTNPSQLSDNQLLALLAQLKREGLA